MFGWSHFGIWFNLLIEYGKEETDCEMAAGLSLKTKHFP